MLTSWWVENLLKSNHTRRGGRVAMMSWSPYIRAAIVNLEVILCWTKNRRNLGFLSAMTVNDSMYSVPIGNSPGCLIFFSDGDCNWSLEKFNYSKYFTMFNGDIYDTFWIRATEFNGGGDGVAIINEFDFYIVCYDSLTAVFRRYEGQTIS